MEFWSMHIKQCAPVNVAYATEEVINIFQEAYPNTHTLRIEHQTCSLGTPSRPWVLLTLLIHLSA